MENIGNNLPKIKYEHFSREPICITDDEFAGSEFTRCGLESCTFSELNLSSSVFQDSNMERCEFARLSLSSVIFEQSNMECSAFSAVDLNCSNFDNVYMNALYYY